MASFFGGLASAFGFGPATVMVVGGGGREHAIALKLAESPQVGKVLVAPGNGGTAASGGKLVNLKVNVKDKPAVVAAAKSNRVKLVVVGPEDPLADGLCDDMMAAGVPCFGPSAGAAMLEVSKAFSKDFMARHNLRTARYATFTDADAAKAHIKSIDYRVVVKASGLAAGKGVLLPTNQKQTLAAIDQVMVKKEFGAAGDEVVLEEFLEGQEASLLAFCDGKTVVGMPAAQDHKRALDGDKGLNTGGMGAYAPAPALTPELRADAISMMQKTVTEMANEGNPYKGILYAGLMLTSEGPSLLEYNCRFGDPETQVLLPLLESDLYTIMTKCVQGKLSASDVEWKEGAAATVVAASPGYPLAYPKGHVITGCADAEAAPGVSAVYHAGTKTDAQDVVTSGGRVLTVTGTGVDLKSALDAAYGGLEKIHFEGMHYRKDIGWRALAQLEDESEEASEPKQKRRRTSTPKATKASPKSKVKSPTPKKKPASPKAKASPKRKATPKKATPVKKSPKKKASPALTKSAVKRATAASKAPKDAPKIEVKPASKPKAPKKKAPTKAKAAAKAATKTAAKAKPKTRASSAGTKRKAAADFKSSGNKRRA